ncbi:FAD-dependent oxidoreductase [Sorangium sp. So ce394]|uniref:FAD-dependent oxidoreductase n=1 Tax=Sorangium sp. So ce394 TaxID=3133310 RepID=UPI003F5C444B
MQSTSRRGAGQRHVVVIGGGLAGTAAAVLLAERGVAVTLVEREAYLGGRAGAWTERLRDGTTFEMERGFHAFFRHYANVRALLGRIDPDLSLLTPLSDYPLLGPGGAVESFSGLPTRTPLNVAALLLRSPSVRLSDLLRIDVRGALTMFTFDPEQTYLDLDATTAKEYLDGLRLAPGARQMLFDVFAHSFFNPDSDYSAAELLAMFHFYFLGNREGLVFDVVKEPFSTAVWRPMERYLRARGVAIASRREARAVEREEGRFAVRLDAGERIACDAVVLAVTVPAVRQLVAASPALAALEGGVGSLEVAPPFAVWRLFLDRPCAPERAPFAGTTGLGLLDNISLYERFEGESRRIAGATGGSVVELHGYALPEAMDEGEIRADLLSSLHRAYPETAAARVLDERFLLRRDCPAFRPGSHARRPGVRTPLPAVVLAGDYVKLPFPSGLMERATASGFLAANALLERFGLPVGEVAHGPIRGLLTARLARLLRPSRTAPARPVPSAA